MSDLLMWVGTNSYPTIQSFVEESARLGVSKRISAIPKDYDLQKDVVFLAHDEGEKGAGKIFGFFRMTKIELIVDTENEHFFKKLLETEIIKCVDGGYGKEEKRGCGFRQWGAMYIVSNIHDFKELWEIAQKNGKFEICSGLVVFKEPIPYNDTRFRGYRYINRNELLKNEVIKEVVGLIQEKVIKTRR